VIFSRLAQQDGIQQNGIQQNGIQQNGIQQNDIGISIHNASFFVTYKRVQYAGVLVPEKH
jgi:hypothetical protein